MSFDVVSATISADVAKDGTFNVSYPDDRDDGDYAGGFDHQLVAIGSVFKATEGKISVSFGATNITVTYKGETTIPDGSSVRVQLDRAGADDSIVDALADPGKMARGELVIVNLGAPLAIDADGVSVSAIITDAAVIGGALADGGVATFDVPRNVVITGAASVTSVTFTVTGTDAYGNVLVENITGPTGATTAAGKKAFKTITAISVSGTTTAAVTIGNGDVLGLPVFLPAKGYVVKELEDGAAATAGTLLAGDSAVATASTGDVRGTYDPNSAADGAKDFQLIAFLPDPSYKGVDQYDG